MAEAAELRRLPSVDVLLRTAAARKASTRFGREVVRLAIREAIAEARSAGPKAQIPGPDALLARAMHLAGRAFFGTQPVINATGVLLHTGLGRAPLSAAVAKAVGKVSTGYADLEADRETGGRGRRGGHAEFLLRALTGAEDALVVNNNAAALLLILAALAKGREVPVSRGELIEIGGEFRLPDIMRASGAKLVEVGTTNRTRLADYERALSARTGLILKVHPSNYRVQGFAQEAPLGALAELGRRSGIPVVHDLGSGLLTRLRGVPADEPAVTESLAAGASLACFSGDKLLGGPQAGIVLGQTELVTRLRRHPMARALRVDVMTVAAVEGTLRAYATGDESSLPTWRAARTSRRTLRARARAIAADLPATVVDTQGAPGGGSMPGHELPSAGLRIAADRPERLAALLRSDRPPVFCRIEAGAIVVDLLAVAPEEDGDLRRALLYALGQSP